MGGNATFDFNLKNHTGLSEIVYGKGGFLSIMTVSIAVFCLIALFAPPWQDTMPEMAFRTFFLLFFLYALLVYYKAMIRLSVDQDNIYVKAWKNERTYARSTVISVKTTYYASWGVATIRIKSRVRGGFYVLWAPNFDRDRYDLYQKMKEHLA